MNPKNQQNWQKEFSVYTVLETRKFRGLPLEKNVIGEVYNVQLPL